MTKFATKKKVTEKLNHVLQVEFVESRVLEQPQNNSHELSFIHALDDNTTYKQLDSSLILQQIHLDKDHTQQDLPNSRKIFKTKYERKYQSFGLENLPVKNNQTTSFYPKQPRTSKPQQQRIQQMFLKRLRSNNSIYNGNELEQIKRENNLIRQKNLKHLLSTGQLKNQIMINTINATNFNSMKTTQFFNEKQQQNSRDLSGFHKQFLEMFQKSSVIKMQNYIMSKLPTCQECLNCKNIVRYDSEFDCVNGCNSITINKVGEYMQKSQQKKKFKAPLLGVLFEIENFEKNQRTNSEFPLFDLLTEITSQIKKIQSYLLQLQLLKVKIQKINNMKKQHQITNKYMKDQLIRFLKEDIINNSTFYKESRAIGSTYSLFSQVQSFQKKTYNKKQDFSDKIKQYISQSFMEQMMVWSHIELDEFKQSPKLYELLLKQAPSFYLPFINELVPMLLPLTSNFALKTITLSTSKPVSFTRNLQDGINPLSLNNTNWIVDGPILLPQFQYIKNLQIKFQGKRSFKQLTQLFAKIPETVEQIQFFYDCKINSHPSSQQFPLLSKICAFKMCKKLHVEISNYNYNDIKDLMEMSKIISKKKELTLIIKKNIYARGYRYKRLQSPQHNLFQQQDQELISNQKNQNDDANYMVLNNIIKKVGKGIVKLHLSISLAVNKERLYHYLILSGYSKLTYLTIDINDQNQLSERQQSFQQKQQKNKQSSAQKVFQRMLFRKQWVINSLTKHPKKHMLNNKIVRNAIFGMLLGN